MTSNVHYDESMTSYVHYGERGSVIYDCLVGLCDGLRKTASTFPNI